VRSLLLLCSQEIKAIFDKIGKLYSHIPEFARIKKTDFLLIPRATSALLNKSGEWLDIYGDGSYRLKYPQVYLTLLTLAPDAVVISDTCSTPLVARVIGTGY